MMQNTRATFPNQRAAKMEHVAQIQANIALPDKDPKLNPNVLFLLLRSSDQKRQEAIGQALHRRLSFGNNKVSTDEQCTRYCRLRELDHSWEDDWRRWCEEIWQMKLMLWKFRCSCVKRWLRVTTSSLEYPGLAVDQKLIKHLPESLRSDKTVAEVRK